MMHNEPTACPSTAVEVKIWPGREKTGRDGGSLKLLLNLTKGVVKKKLHQQAQKFFFVAVGAIFFTAPFLTVCTLNNRFFASLVNCTLRWAFSEHWRKETEKSKRFFVGRQGHSNEKETESKSCKAKQAVHGRLGLYQ